jgi:para-nitrobenzyl esterase
MVPEMGDALIGHGPMSEDCLTLNVWTPGLSRSAKRPVMVWFHGGGFRTGWSGSIMYDGQELARKHDVVVVGVNHRLNLFGFLYLDEIAGGAKYGQPANAGLLDMVLALEWVRDNIGTFGGDPGNVTLFGQSGGGGKVSNLQAMPRAKGLFHRAIVQSTISETALRGKPRAEATQTAEVLLSRLGVKPNQLGDLWKFSSEQLLAAMNGGQGPAETNRSAGAVAGGEAIEGDLSLRLVPVVDGPILPANPFDPVAPGISASVPLIVGSVETESVPYAAPKDPYWTMDSMDDATLLNTVKGALRADDAAARHLVDIYRKNRPKASNLDIAMILTSDAGTLRTAGYTIAEHKAAQNKAPVYLYEFQWNSPVRQGKVRAMHGVELGFVFDHVDDVQWMIGNGADRYALAEKISGAWVAFARTGNPNHKGLPAWRPFNAQSRPTMVFDNECGCVDDPHGEERLAIASLQGNQTRG